MEDVLSTFHDTRLGASLVSSYPGVLLVSIFDRDTWLLRGWWSRYVFTLMENISLHVSFLPKLQIRGLTVVYFLNSKALFYRDVVSLIIYMFGSIWWASYIYCNCLFSWLYVFSFPIQVRIFGSYKPFLHT